MLRTGTQHEKRMANRLAPIVKYPHWVLATLVRSWCGGGGGGVGCCLRVVLQQQVRAPAVRQQRAYRLTLLDIGAFVCDRATKPQVIFNTVSSVALPLCMDRLVSSVVALIVSSTAIVLFGEILPQVRAAPATAPPQLPMLHAAADAACSCCY